MKQSEIIKKSWSELSDREKEIIIPKMQHAGDRDDSRYPSYTYQFKKDGSFYGWMDKNFFS
jgi:hypothetical protein